MINDDKIEEIRQNLEHLDKEELQQVCDLVIDEYIKRTRKY